MSLVYLLYVLGRHGQTHGCVLGCVVNTGRNTGVLLAVLKTTILSRTIHGREHGRVPGRVSTPFLLQKATRVETRPCSDQRCPNPFGKSFSPIFLSTNSINKPCINLGLENSAYSSLLAV